MLKEKINLLKIEDRENSNLQQQQLHNIHQDALRVDNLQMKKKNPNRVKTLNNNIKK